MQISLKAPVPDAVRKELEEYDDLTAHLLYHRGVDTAQKARDFLHPEYERDLHDPFLMQGMDIAVSRIVKAVKEQEKIVVYSDYDCDGIPGGVLLHDFFQKVNANFENYIPHRHNEGYGLNVEAIETLHAGGAKLIITVDCGITDVVSVVRANELGMEVIITDHHLPQEELPPALTILNPKLIGNTYPFKELCGSGVAYKLVQALLSTGEFDVPAGWEKWLLDMAGIATIADMVPLVGENRALAHFGLVVLRKSPRPGLRQLLRKIRTNQRTLVEDDIGFMIGPRINAASRMGEPMQAFRMLTTKSEAEGAQYASELEAINRVRKTAVATITKEVKKKLVDRETISPVIVLGNPQWRPSLLGLVANSVAEEYSRPVFLWGREGNNVLKGSCRSDGFINLVELMTHTKETFVEFGGHAMSGGFSIREEAVYTIEEQLFDAFQKLPANEASSILREADHELSLAEVDRALVATLSHLAPYGEANPKPLFLFRNVTPEEVSWFGKAKEHLKVAFETDKGRREAIAFFAVRELGKNAKSLAAGISCTILGAVEHDPFKNAPRIRIVNVAM